MSCLRVVLIVLYPFFILHFQQLALLRLGIPPLAVPAVLFLAILGSFVNLPLWASERRRQVVALNLGGGLLPLLLSSLALSTMPTYYLPIIALITCTTAVTAYLFSQYQAGVGVAMTPLPPALAAALLAAVLVPEAAALVAFCAASMGVLLGTDLVRLPRILCHSPAVVLIGGAGTMDGILMTGLLATLLTA